MATKPVVGSALFVLVLAGGACDEDVPARFGPDDFETASGEADSEADANAARRSGMTQREGAELGPYPSSGWLDFDDAAVTPWCGTVLVAPDVALTATHCVSGIHVDRVRLGFGEVASQGLRARRLEPLEAAPELTAVVLAQPVADVEPATLGGRLLDGTRIESVSYLHVPRGDTSARWVWRGESEAGEVLVRDGEPNCHSDPGAGAFDPEGNLVGIVVGGEVLQGTCVDTIRLAHPITDQDPFDEALALGR